MTDRGYDKAQQIWNETEPQFGDRVHFEQAFPTIAELRLRVEETNYGYPTGNVITSSETTLRKFVDCTNPRCKNGGVDVQRILRNMIEQGDTVCSFDEKCQGGEHEKGKFLRTCMHAFNGSMTIVYKQAESADVKPSEGSA